MSILASNRHDHLSLEVMNGIMSLRTSLVRNLTDIFMLISVLLWISLDLYDTSYPDLSPLISLTNCTSLHHILARRCSKAKVEIASTRHPLTAQYSVLTSRKSAVVHTAVQPSRHPACQPARQPERRHQSASRNMRPQGRLVRVRHPLMAKVVYIRKGILPLATMY
jgi:hypothetical protein